MIVGVLWMILRIASYNHFKKESETVFVQFVIINIISWIAIFIIWRYLMQILL
jgi:hypothetical protein